MNPAFLGPAVGLIGGLGLALILVALVKSKNMLSDRVEPHLRFWRDPALLPVTYSGLKTVGKLLFWPLVKVTATVLEKLGSTPNSVRRRIQLSGAATSVMMLRTQQCVWAMGGLILGLATAITLTVTRGMDLAVGMGLVSLMTVGAALLRDQLLTRQATRRQAELSRQVPDAAELFALAVSAGESIPEALARVADICGGVLQTELVEVVASSRAGTSLAVALEALAQRNDCVELNRLVEAVRVALERGTPLTAVLRDQARDIREASRQNLLEDGGRREIAMLVPVVFILLPITVIFALYPGLVTLRLGP